MKRKGFLIMAALISTTILLTANWMKDPIAITPKPHLEPTSMPTRSPLPFRRQSVTLNDGTYDYHLNLTSFELEFPNLQTYQCNLLQKPRPEKQGQAGQKLVILAVKSSPVTGVRRAAIRKTWGKEEEIDGYKLRTIFLLGKTPVSGQMELVNLESLVYGDIIQWDIFEGHHNLSLKERCFLEWLYLDMPQAEFIFKGDDDEYVNTGNVVRYIAEHGTPNTVHGFHQHRPPVLRETKYRITKSLYPQDKYPAFVSGGGFIFPGAGVPSLYNASQYLPVFPLDDVYFGFLILAAQLTYHNDPRFYVKGLKYDTCKYKEALVVHGINCEDMERVWQEVRTADCQGPTTSRDTPTH
ncbi:beta-1,3-galactosyltransferase 5-like isoform X2 [Hyperolius riggenbachi]